MDCGVKKSANLNPNFFKNEDPKIKSTDPDPQDWIQYLPVSSHTFPTTKWKQGRFEERNIEYDKNLKLKLYFILPLYSQPISISYRTFTS